MSSAFTSYVRLFKALLKNKDKNRKNLKILGQYFIISRDPEDILADFHLTQEKLEILQNLSDRTDGWYPVKDIIPATDPERGKNLLEDLLEAGLIRLKLFQKLVSLSDSGRYILILCAEIV
ncbi:MAG: hypothetical protein LBF22_15045 [Deltaproteobacteria bacterium]|jgi:hypothetical protein|nr:hypothetical protein [Deltaproteobacteria bacterium]